MAEQQGPPTISFEPARLQALYAEHAHDALADALLEVLEHFRAYTYLSLSREGHYFVNSFAKHFLYLYTQPDFIPSDAHLMRFIGLNPVICNLVAVSSFRTTDPYLHVLLDQQANLLKILTLYNPRCRTRLDRRALFDGHASAASLWYFSFLSNYKTCLVTAEGWEHLREHLAYDDPRLEANSVLAAEGYFGCTYVNHAADQAIKRRINAAFQRLHAGASPCSAHPSSRKAVVLTSMWFPGHSVYRCMHRFIARLAEEFELTLVHLGAPNPLVDGGLFRGGVRHFQLGGPRPEEFLANDFALAFYPDIGMNVESIYCANLRLAPVQVCGYGHPVSTRGALIDYWLGGREVEEPGLAARNYDERLVLIPGAGVVPNRPRYTLRGLPCPTDAVHVNCPWFGQKINHPLLGLLRRILARAAAPTVFRFFPSSAAFANSFMPLRHELTEALGAEHLQVFPHLPYPEYMAALEQGHFSIDSHPFGGYATVMDSLHVGKPMVAIEGSRFYSRSAAYLLRTAGLGELVAADPEAYVETVVALIDDVAFRDRMTERLRDADLDARLYASDHARSFAEAMRYLVDHHETLRASGERSPLTLP